MTLQNLLAIKRLQEHTAERAGIRKLLDAARRNLADAHVEQVSADNRFDAAYKCIMQCAMLGLWAQWLAHLDQPAGTPPDRHPVPGPDAGRVERRHDRSGRAAQAAHVSDYEGDPISGATLASCLDEASRLLAHTEAWLRRQHPEWMAGT